ncbi:MAG: hypothetical protein KGL53_12645, partial [Elusimicrobia bacterium]|nr:hypothetical protein [Elusimicrobiota bacterium]
GPGAARIRGAVSEFNRQHRGRWNLRFGPMGVGPGGAPAARLTALDTAQAFLQEHARELGLDPSQLQLEVARSHLGGHHLLFQQVIDGVPVEFATVKVHLLSDGSVEDFSSSFRSDVTGSPVPRVPESQAASAVAADLGTQAPEGGTLVYLPPPSGGAPRLAWKFSAVGGGSWVYYVDAQDGSILLRYSGLDFASCVTSGVVNGMVYDIDPNHQTGSIARPMAHEKVYVLDGSTYSLTDSSGFYCSQTSGKVFTQLQGPYFSIANFNGPAAHYDNGGGVWQTFSTPLQSDHPYANNAVAYSTINAPAGAVEFLTQFDSLDVGKYTLDAGDITINDDDKVEVLDGDGDEVGTYIGQRSLIKTVAVPGTQMRLRLRTNATGQRNGFSISISSYLTLTSAPGTPDNATSTFTWTRSMTSDGTADEINLFYQLNRMHDYFRSGPDASDAAPIDKVIPVMARSGPNLANAFYDPVHQDLTIGDFNSGGGADSQFALDATVIHHEYTHAVVDTIFPILNIGQFGAISEALADYFSASSLNDPKIGGYVAAAFGEATLRNLDCTSGGCKLFPADWDGEIHDDSRMVSQALWEIRSSLMSSPPAGGDGQKCADDLVFGALFYFPDSFADLEQAMIDVSDRAHTNGLPCGSTDGLQSSLIRSRFSNHGITIPTGDADVYEPNDGTASATDITTASVISARIWPNADLDYYVFGAGTGLVTVTLGLPHAASAPSVYTAYEMQLIDSKFNVVKTALPRLDVNPTLAGDCPNTDCQTSNAQVTLSYEVPSPGLYYLLVSAPPSDSGVISNTNSTAFYTLTASLPPAGPVSAGIVSATFDHDRIDFSVPVSTYYTTQPLTFHHARLLDQDHQPLPATDTDLSSPWLTMVSSTSQFGTVSGTVVLTSGFSTRFPSVGNVYLEVFGVNKLGHVQSLGTSAAIALSGTGGSLTAYNNLFDPARGEHAIVKWTSSGAGHVRLRLYTISGQLVTTLVDEDRPAGEGSVSWYGVNGVGQRVASGVYLVHLSAPGIEETKKIVVVK